MNRMWNHCHSTPASCVVIQTAFRPNVKNVVSNWQTFKTRQEAPQVVIMTAAHTECNSYTLMGNLVFSNSIPKVKKQIKINTFKECVSLPTTIRVNSKPRFTDFLYTWLGRLAKPTYPSRFFCCCWKQTEKHLFDQRNLLVFAHSE